jgi:membrane-bound lytic murein transglycosylase D
MYNYLPRETQNYVPKFIAMAYMMNFYSDYGITPVFVENMKQAYTQVKCYDHMDFTIIAEKLEMTSEELMSYNPELKRASIPYSNNEYMLNVPYDNVYLFEMHEEEILALSLVKYEEQLAIEAAKPKVVYYYVRKGDNLLTIGRRYGVTVSQLKAWNGIRGTTIHPKQRLRIEQKPH